MSETMLYQKQLKHFGHYDVVVLGGGPSGVCAAMEASRGGAKVLLVEACGMLGGMATTALVGPFMTNYNREGERPVVGGLYREIIERLAEKQAAILPEYTDSPSIHTSFLKRYHRHVTPFDSFMLQLVLDEMTQESGVEVLLYTRFVDCLCENSQIRQVVLAALEGLVYVTGDVFIDCTGNADAAHAAGVATWKGEEESGIPQPGTLMFEVDGVCDENYLERPEKPVKAYRMPQKGRYKVNHYHVYNIDATDSRSMTAGHMQARRQVLDAYRVLREKTPGFEQATLVQTASVLGMRESRHIEGHYKLTVQDVSEGVCFPDRVALFAFGMDVHSRRDTDHGNFKIEVADVYYIPYRSLLPLGCDNLLVAGKTISCQSQAAGGLRVMPCAMALGQAAGAAAAIAKAQNVLPKDVPVDMLQQVLRAHGAILD